MRLESFLPSHLLRRLQSAGPGDLRPRRDLFDGALLFSDLTGFTALTERLQRRGREGAEEITGVLRRAFRPVLREIALERGSIVSFAGDSVFVVFDGASAARRAVAAATRIQSAYLEGIEIGTSAGPVTLRLRQAVHFGRVHGLHLGTPERRIYVVAGPSVVALARHQAQAEPGELRISVAARRRAAGEAPASAAPERPVKVAREVLAPYVPAHVRASGGRFRGEYRRVTLAFLETQGWDEGVVQPFSVRLQGVLDRYEGVLVGTDISPAGTIWFCAFGAPAVHEDDPERGARAALELAAELPGLVIRGGIHTGVVANILVGTSWRRSFELIGDATNTAARAAKQARWAEIVATREVVDAAPVLVTRPRGMHRVKGKSRPMELRAIVGTRREAVPAMPMTPFLGRDREMETLGDALASAAAGRGSAIGIRGDAGLGKSRIKLEVSRLARARGFEIREARATPFGGGPFQVAIDLLAAKLGIERRAPPRTVRSRIATFAKRHGFALHDRRRLEEIFASGAAGPGLDADALRLNRAVALSATLLATTRPQLLVLEDLHWSDPGSQELLEHVAREASGSATLVLLLYRPGYDPPRGVREIRLKELPGRRVRQLLRSILGRPSRSVEDLVAARAGGNPFYVEEVSRHLLESGILVARGKTFRLVGLPGPGDLPATVESVITSRLSRLSPLARRFCEIGAVVGRSFSSALLDRHPDLKGRTGAALQELGERGLVFETGRDGGEHIFKHAVTRDAAYGSILVARRRSLHRWAAREIESVDAGASPALRGYHWERAGRNGTARACFLAAAEQAATAHALQDAIRFYRDYLGLATRDRPEVLEARLALGRVLHRSGDFEGGNHELGAVVAAASRASRQRQRLAALNALGDLELERNRFGDARPHYEAALGLAEEIGDASRQASILVGLGRVGVVTSRHDEAETLLSRARALYERAHDRAGVARVLSRLAILEDARGRETHATALIQEAIAIHRETGDRGAEGEALGFLGASFTHRGYAAKGALCFREALAIARELGHRRLEAMWLNNLAIADKQLGRLDDASSSFQQAAKIFRTIGVRSYHGQSIANLGGVRADQHRFEEAHQLIRQGLAIVREIGDRRSEAMALTILAKALEAEGRLEEALDASRRGGEIARGLHQVRMEIQALRRQIALLRVMEPRGKRIGALLSRAAILTADLEPNELHLRLLCERGHLQLATGQGARPLLSECGELVRRVRIDEGSDAYAAYLKLARAVERCERGDPLVHGLDPADVPEGVSRWAASARP